MGEFQGAKLLLQLGRQLCKPLSTRIINFAKRHPSFRQHVLVAPGRYYHWCENVTKIYLRSNKLEEGSNVGNRRVKEIDESVAMEVGAQLMLEALVFVILAAFVIYESNRSATRSQLLEDKRERDFDDLLRRKNELSRRLEHQTVLIQQLLSRLRNYHDKVD